MSNKIEKTTSVNIQKLTKEQINMIDKIAFFFLEKGFVEKPSRSTVVRTLIEKYYYSQIAKNDKNIPTE